MIVKTLLVIVLVALFIIPLGSAQVQENGVLTCPGRVIVEASGSGTTARCEDMATPEPTPTVTLPPPKATPTPTPEPLPTSTPTMVPTGSEPFVGAPLCPGEHDTTLFHTLWNDTAGCHYDHEHGKNPFTMAVLDAFPGFDLFSLLGGVGIGHTNPSSPAENTAKHGGFKWQVQPTAPQGCVVGFEDATYGVDAAVVQYHNFGPQNVELEGRIHSTAAIVRICSPGGEPGYMYVVQLQDYGQRVSPYQGTVLAYPDTPIPAYGAGFGPYISVDCIGTGLVGCRESLDQITSRNLNANSTWTSKATGSGERPEVSSLFRLLFRIRDTYQVLDSADVEHPFTWPFVCGGATYDPTACRYNNSTSRVHEVAGTIPAAWDNLAGFDTDPEVGRVTAEGFVTRYGQLSPTCTGAGSNCYPIKLIRAPVGRYGGELSANKVSNPDPITNPERDIYFCSSTLCAETDAGAVPSGWIGPGN